MSDGRPGSSVLSHTPPTLRMMEMTDPDRSTPGPAEWVRVDFHLHSPAVATFVGPPDLNLDTPDGRAEFATRYVDRLEEGGVRLGAITDYNHVDPDWFQLLRVEADARGIVLLPGAELTIETGKAGLHVLLVCDAESAQDVNNAIGSIDMGARPLIEDRVQRPLELRCPLDEAARALRDALPNCLLIPAHPEGSNGGLLKSFKPARALEKLEALQADALEHLSARGEATLASVDAARWGRFQGRTVEFDDPKRLEDVAAKRLTDGTPRATWMRLSDMSAGAVRSALEDPETRVRRGEPPPLPTHPWISRIEVAGAGFFRDLDLRLSPHLTTLIGGRGVGKSAVLQLIRFALDSEPYLGAGPAVGFIEHVLGPGGQVALQIESGDRIYRVRRLNGEPTTVHGPDGELLDLSPSDVFGEGGSPIVMGQRELHGIAEDRRARRQLIDDLVGRAARAVEVRERSLRASLQENAAELERLEAQIDAVDGEAAELRSVQHELDEIERRGGTERLEEHRAAQELAEKLTRVGGAGESVRDTVHDQVEAVRVELDELLEGWPEAADEELTAFRQDGTRQAAELREALQRALSAADTLASTALAAKKAADGRRAARSKELAEIKRDLSIEGTLDADRLLGLVSRRDRLRAKINSREKLEEQHRDAVQHREALLKRFRVAHQEALELRRKAAAQVVARINGQVQIEVVSRGDRDKFVELLKELLRGSGMQATAISSLADSYDDGADIARAVREDAEQLPLSSAMTRALVGWVDEPGNEHRLQLVVPPDHIEIQLQLPDGRFRDLLSLSLGQRATAMLLLLFATDPRPLILDQPEDDLDNRFVFDDVVPLLRRAKGGDPEVIERQVVVATHNANIPVLGDAEQIAILGTRPGDTGQVGGVLNGGSIDRDPVREGVRSVLEGGEEAFERRLRKYGVRGSA